MEIKGHKKIGKKKRGEPWPRKYVPQHHEGKCPYCNKHVKNTEQHIQVAHKFEKPRIVKGKIHGHA
ncbi:MAG: hypothetical protein K6T16_03300 [Candidatus Pacearchaeota archaeon]|nr:hypothetical protein [Candidatus Pacearchaeota archaeon]